MQVNQPKQSTAGNCITSGTLMFKYSEILLAKKCHPKIPWSLLFSLLISA